MQNSGRPQGVFRPPAIHPERYAAAGPSAPAYGGYPDDNTPCFPVRQSAQALGLAAYSYGVKSWRAKAQASAQAARHSKEPASSFLKYHICFCRSKALGRRAFHLRQCLGDQKLSRKYQKTQRRGKSALAWMWETAPTAPGFACYER